MICDLASYWVKRYFFNIFNGEQMFDKTGTLLSGLHEIRLHMFSTAMALSEAEDFEDHVWEMEAIDERGRIVCTLSFGIELAKEK